MAKKTFGSRSRTPASPTAGDGSNNKYSKVDLTRGVIAALVQTYATVADAERDSLEMRIRLLQDQLAEAKRLSGARSHKSDDLAWVDIWRPHGAAE